MPKRILYSLTALQLIGRIGRWLTYKGKTMPDEMSLREHLEELRARLFRILVCVTTITFFCLLFGFRPFEINGVQFVFYYPYPDIFHNFSIQLTSFMQATLLPQGVKLIQTAPGQAFFAQLYVSLLVGMIASMPIIIREIYGFISPAFDKQLKGAGIKKVFLPTICLFLAGIAFSYIAVIPFTLNFLYKYGQAIGVETFLNINDFISFVLQFFLGFGIAFELPIIMYAISLTDLIEPKFWRHNFRYAIIVLVIFGAIITPDGSGLTMWFVAGPMIALYLIGMLAIERRARRSIRISVNP
jgi:sec-independent protein translocase protein TatC